MSLPRTTLSVPAASAGTAFPSTKAKAKLQITKYLSNFFIISLLHSAFKKHSSKTIQLTVQINERVYEFNFANQLILRYIKCTFMSTRKIQFHKFLIIYSYNQSRFQLPIFARGKGSGKQQVKGQPWAAIIGEDGAAGPEAGFGDGPAHGGVFCRFRRSFDNAYGIAGPAVLYWWHRHSPVILYRKKRSLWLR